MVKLSAEGKEKSQKEEKEDRQINMKDIKKDTHTKRERRFKNKKKFCTMKLYQKKC